MIARTGLLPVLVALLPAAGLVAQAPAPAGAGTAVARAGSVRVSRDEVRREVLLLRRGGDSVVVLRTLTVDGLEQVAREILERKLLAAEAHARGLDREPGVTEMTRRAVELVLADIVLARTVAATDVSEPALRAFYESHADSFRTDPRRKARHIVVTSSDEAAAAAAEVKAGRPFEAVASERNVDSTRRTGGNLGWVPRGLMVPAFDAALFGLDVGQVSDMVKTAMGFHLIRVEDIDPGTLPAFELVRDRVAEAVQQDAVSRLKARLWQQQAAVVDRAAMATLLDGSERQER
jgi:peptidyl-prolyl cis-trans isomerase C